MSKNDLQTLIEFLNFPLKSTEDVFAKFRSLPNAIERGTAPRRFIYIPGTRANKVILVAHADTVWDAFMTRRESTNELLIEDDIIRSANPNCGIGADDRAGCAMLWLLRESGHSLLITDGEENGILGSSFLMRENSDVADEINSVHQFMIQIDRRNSSDYKCYHRGTDEFRTYVNAKTDYTEPDRKSATDIVELCRDICGVNLSTGYYNEHTSGEYLVISEWQNTLDVLKSWLAEEELPKFEFELELDYDSDDDCFSLDA